MSSKQPRAKPEDVCLSHFLGTWSQLCLVWAELVETGGTTHPSARMGDGPLCDLLVMQRPVAELHLHRIIIPIPNGLLHAPPPQLHASDGLAAYSWSHKWPKPLAFGEADLRFALSPQLAAFQILFAASLFLSVLACCASDKSSLVLCRAFCRYQTRR